MSNTEKNLTKANLKLAISQFIDKEKLSVGDVAQAIGCPEPVLGRILCGITWPSDSLLKRCYVMFEVGYEEYKKRPEADKEIISMTSAVSGVAAMPRIVSLLLEFYLGGIVYYMVLRELKKLMMARFKDGLKAENYDSDWENPRSNPVVIWN